MIMTARQLTADFNRRLLSKYKTQNKYLERKGKKEGRNVLMICQSALWLWSMGEGLNLGKTS